MSATRSRWIVTADKSLLNLDHVESITVGDDEIWAVFAPLFDGNDGPRNPAVLPFKTVKDIATQISAGLPIVGYDKL